MCFSVGLLQQSLDRKEGAMTVLEMVDCSREGGTGRVNDGRMWRLLYIEVRFQTLWTERSLQCGKGCATDIKARRDINLRQHQGGCLCVTDTQ